MTDESKANQVIEILTAAAFQPPLGWDEEAALLEWSEALALFSTPVLTAAAARWVIQNREFPDLDDFVSAAEQMRRVMEDDPESTADDNCEVCGGNHYEIVVDRVRNVETFASKQRHRGSDGEDDGDPENRQYTEVKDTHAEPCPLCLPRRRALYDEGHWEPHHKPCDECDYYRDQKRMKKRTQKAKARA